MGKEINQKRLRVGFAAGFMDGFSKVGIDTFHEYAAKLQEAGKTQGFEIIHYPTPMTRPQEAVNIRQDLDDKNIDFLLFFHPSYINGDLIYEVMKARAPIGLWAIEEPRDEGPMPLASFVNLCQNTGIAHQMFKGNPKKFKWFFGPLEGPFFKPRFDITIKALRAIKNLRNARVAQIGKLADGHINHTVDNRDIYARLGVDVSRDFEIEDVIRLSLEVPEKLVQEELQRLAGATTRQRIGEDKILDSVKIFLAVKKICEENEYNAVAFSCQTKLMARKGMSGCLIEALLNNIGIPSGCEADILGTVSMLILHLLSDRQSTVLMDLPSFDIQDNSLMLWHCGTSPFDMADKNGVLLDRHYFSDYTDNPWIKDCGPITDVVFRESDVTVLRITGEANHFYYLTGRTFEGKKTFCGSRGWVKDLRLYDNPVKVLDLVNTLLLNAYAHHYPMVMQNVGNCIEELAYWLDLKKVRKAEYKDYQYVD
jgi:hypothetical protein